MWFFFFKIIHLFVIAQQQIMQSETGRFKILLSFTIPVPFGQILQVVLSLERFLFLMADIASNSPHYSSERGTV